MFAKPILRSALTATLLLFITLHTRAANEGFEIISSSPTSYTIKFTLPNYEFIPVVTEKGVQYKIWSEDGASLLDKGNPDLVKFSVSLAIGDMDQLKTSSTSYDPVIINAIDIAPSKGNIYRNIDYHTIPFEWNNDTYTSDYKYPGKISDLNMPYIIRNTRAQTINIYPFQYNPVTRQLFIHHEVLITVTKTDDAVVNPLIKKNTANDASSEYEQIYKRHFLNYAEVAATRYTPVSESGNMLIVCYPDFMAAMQPFVDWKTQTGMKVEMISVDDAGGSDDAIKDYVQNYYDNNGLTYLLLVGDEAEVPTSGTMYAPSDNEYGYTSGNDSYPDVFVGRFSCESTAHVTTMVNKVLQYEKYPDASGNWYSRGIGIGSNEGAGYGDDGEADWEHQRNIREKLMNYNYTSVAELYDGNHSGEDASGNPTASDVFDEVMNGVGIMNYTGHGYCSGSGTTNFNTSDVYDLTNTNMLPFFISVACVNGEFTNNYEECFGEAWLRAENNGELTGAVATFMSTVNQSWAPPMSAQDEMNDILTESYNDNIKHTIGGITMNGCMLMNDEYGSDGDEMTDTWVIFGDPSLILRTATPLSMTVTHIDEVAEGTATLMINCDVEGAMIGLSSNGELLGSGIVTGGSADIALLRPLSDNDVVIVTATAYNRIPYIGDIDVYKTASNINDASHILNVSVYPNPVQENVTLSFTINGDQSISVYITDETGRIVAPVIDQQTFSNGQHTISYDAGNLASGIYFIELTNHEEKAITKLIVAH